MKRIFLICILLTAAGEVRAQSGATFHVFPQIADGVVPATTTGFISTFLVTNTGSQPANCTIQLYGGMASRLAGSPTFNLPVSGSFTTISTTLSTGNLLALTSGYATLNCSQPVAANVAYAYASLSAVLSGATVFSTPPATRAQLLSLAGTRLAFAISNDTDGTGQYQIRLTTSGGQTVTTGNLSLAPRSNVARFIDEVLDVPAGFAGAFTVTGSVSSPFSLLGLVFVGNVFTSQPAAILAQ